MLSSSDNPSPRNIALLIEYDGTGYGGWQVQKNAQSIQGVIEDRLTRLLGEAVKLTGAGRTDAGVHARGQVANFRTSKSWPADKIRYALNGTLPRDIAVVSVADVPVEFHSRFDAIARRYSYNVTDRKTAIGKEFSAFFPFRLSIEKMNSAAQSLIGEKSFKSFSKFADEQRHFICDVKRAEWKEVRSDCERRAPSFGINPSGCSFEIEANRFLHGMVRAIVGTLIDVGRGKLTVEDFRSIIEARDRSRASMSAPACGLFLQEVKYRTDIFAK